jgi:hypothetical protein
MHCANCSSLFELAVGAAPAPLAPGGAEVAVALELVDAPPQPASNSTTPTIANPLARLGRRVRAGTPFAAPVLVVLIMSTPLAPFHISLVIKAVTIARLMSPRG